MFVASQKHETPSVWQLVMVVLSVYVLGAIVAETFLQLSEGTIEILDYADMVICFIFIGDWTTRFILADSKMAFLKWGWIDLISSIPSLPMFRWGRAVRVIRILRILRAFRSTKILIAVLFQNRARSAFASVATISLLLTILAAIAILNLETDPESNIKSPGDALWWAWVTVTTVGYGDKYPLTTEGRVIAAVLMTAGVGLFGTFTGYIASIFLEPEEKKQTIEIDSVLAELQTMHRMIDELRSMVESLGRGPRADVTPNQSTHSAAQDVSSQASQAGSTGAEA